MINYNIDDHRGYVAERTAFVCLLAGIEPLAINVENYDTVRQALHLTLSGVALRKALTELSAIMYFSILESGD